MLYVPKSTYAPNKIPTPAPGKTYAPGLYPGWSLRNRTFAPPKPTPGPDGRWTTWPSTTPPITTYTFAPIKIPTPVPGQTYPPNKIPTPSPGKTYAPGLYPGWSLLNRTFAPPKPTPGPDGRWTTLSTTTPPITTYTFTPIKIPTPAPTRYYWPGLYPGWSLRNITFAPPKPTPGPDGCWPTWPPTTPQTTLNTFASNRIPNLIPTAMTSASARTYAPGKYPGWSLRCPDGSWPILRTTTPLITPNTFAPNRIPSPAPEQTYAPLRYPVSSLLNRLVPTPIQKTTPTATTQYYWPLLYPGWSLLNRTFAPPKPTPGPDGRWPTWTPTTPMTTPNTFAPIKIPIPVPGQTYAPGLIAGWSLRNRTFAPPKPTPGAVESRSTTTIKSR